MDKLRFYKIFFLLLCLSLQGLARAQKKNTVNASVDKNKILIGERIQLTVEATFPANQAAHFFSIDSIPHFVVIHHEKLDTEKTPNGISLKQQFQLTSFDSGHWVIPSFLLDRKIKTDPIPVDVVFSNFDPSKDYHDIKDIITLPDEKDKSWWILPAIISAIIILAIVWLLRQKKSQAVKDTAHKIDAYREAMQQLQQIQKSRGTTKQYYSALTDIFRLYVFRKKGILSLQKSTDDVILQLKGLHLDKELFTQLSQSLQLSDSVKFAKFIPSEQDDKMVFDSIKNSIQRIENSATK